MKTILITGATGYLGSLLSRGFIEKGVNVILLGRNLKALEALYDSLKTDQAIICPFDLTKATLADYETLKESMLQQFGQLDGLIHTAAQLGSLTPIEYYPPSQWLTVLQTNLNSPFLLTQTLFPLLKKAQRAHIVFTTCEAGKNPKAYWGAYRVAHSGIEALASILKEECMTHTNIEIHTIDPGVLPSRLRQSAYPGDSKRPDRDPTAVFEKYCFMLAGVRA